MGVAGLVLTAHTVLLVVASVLLLYPVVSYAWNVAYTEEVLLLSASFLLLASAYVTGFLVESPVASSALDLASSLAAFWAMWRLAGRFVTPDEGDVTFFGGESTSNGGFGGSIPGRPDGSDGGDTPGIGFGDDPAGDGASTDDEEGMRGER